MAVRKIVTVPNKILKSKTKKVKSITDAEIIELIKDLKDTLEDAKEPEGAGLAATQIGSDKRICVVRDFIPIETVDGQEVITEEYVLVNPKIISRSKDMDLDYEGCLSVPDVYGKVRRHKKIKVKAENEDGNTVRLTASGFFGRTIQHEIDHLDGILFTEKVIGETITENQLDDINQHEHVHAN